MLSVCGISVPVGAVYTAVADDFPLSVLTVGNDIRVVCSADMAGFRFKIFRDNFCSFGSGQSGKFYFNSEFLVFRFITSANKKASRNDLL